MGGVDCQCRRTEFVQILLVRPINSVKNRVNLVSDSLQMVDWGLVQGPNWQAQGHSILCGGALALEIPKQGGNPIHSYLCR